MIKGESLEDVSHSYITFMRTPIGIAIPQPTATNRLSEFNLRLMTPLHSKRDSADHPANAHANGIAANALTDSEEVCFF